jgi:hypothetical protein
MRRFSDLTEQEVLALAISNEEEDGQLYADFPSRCGRTIPTPPRCSTAWRRRRASIAGR